MTSNSPTEDSVRGDGSQSGSWVRFEEDEGARNIPKTTEQSTHLTQPIAAPILKSEEYTAAVINPETVHINVNRSVSRSVSPEKPDVVNKMTAVGSSGPQEYSGAVINTESVHHNLDRSNLNRSVSEEPQLPDTSSPTVNPNKPQDARIGMRTVDLRDANNGRPISNSRMSAFGNTVIRQGFGKFYVKYSGQLQVNQRRLFYIVSTLL